MNLKFKKIELHNFLSYKHAEAFLNSQGCVIIIGHNLCDGDQASSNGSGKTAISHAICFALTGKTTNGSFSNIENIYSDENSCWVRLTVQIDDDEIILQRIKSPKSDLKIWINGVNKSGKGIKESTEVLNKYLPDLSYEMVSSIIIMGQGLPYRFSNNMPAKRKEVLEQLTKSDFMIQGIKDKISARERELTAEQSRITTDKAVAEAKIKMHKSTIANKEASLNALGDNAEDRLNSLKEELSEFDLCVESLQAALDKCNSDLLNLNTTYTSNCNEINEEKSITLAPLKSQKDALVLPTSEAKSTIKLLKGQITKYKSITDICPTCGQKIPGYVKIDTSAQESQLAETQSQLDKLLDSSAGIDSEMSTVNHDFMVKIQKLKAVYDKSNKELTDRSRKLTKELKEARQDQTLLNNEIFKLTNTLNNKENLQEDLKVLNKELEAFKSELAKSVADLLEVESHLEVVRKFMVLAKREFRGILLTNIVDFLNIKLSAYGASVFDGIKVRLSLDGNELNIYYGDKTYEMLSGGEQRKIDIIIQLSLRDLMSAQLGITSNLLILDEIFDSLDLTGCKNILNVIYGLTDISSIFIISHRAEQLDITYDSTLVVTKDVNGISSLVQSVV